MFPDEVILSLSVESLNKTRSLVETVPILAGLVVIAPLAFEILTVSKNG
jgi:hypothetical protein